MHVANAASWAFRPPPPATVPRRAGEERSTEEEKHRRKKMYRGAAGLRGGARTGGPDTEKRTGQEKEKGESTGYCWGKQRGRILKRVKRAT